MRIIPLGVITVLLAGATAWCAPDPEAAGNNEGVLVDTLTWQVKGDHELPVAVTINNKHAKYEGTIEAWVGERDSASVFRRTVNVGPGSFCFFLYPHVDTMNGDSTLVVRVNRDRKYNDYSVMLRACRDEWSVLAVLGKDRFITSQDFAPHKVMVSAVRRTGILPDQWYGYRMFDSVLWDGSVTEPLSPVQKKALADWVCGGGRLVLVSRAGDGTVHSPLPELMPDLKITESGSPVRFNAAELPSQGQHAVTGKTVGLGQILFLRMDFHLISTASDDEKAAVLPVWHGEKMTAVLEKLGKTDTRDWTDTYSSMAVPSVGIGDEIRRINLWGAFQPVLARMAGYSSLNFKPILVTMLIYILMVSLVDYVVLRRTGKLPWTWVTFPVLILVFSVYSFFSFYKGRIGDLVRQEIAFEDVAQDGSLRTRSLCCIRNNSNRPVRMEVDLSRSVFREEKVLDESEYYYRKRSERSTLPGMQEQDSGKGAKEILLPGYVGSYLFFAEDQLGKAAVLPFTSSLTRGKDGKLSGGIEARKEYKKAGEPFLYYMGRLYKLDGAMQVSATPEPVADSDINLISRYCGGEYSRRWAHEQNIEAPDSALRNFTRFNGLFAPIMIRQITEDWNHTGGILRGLTRVLNSGDKDRAVVFAFAEENGIDEGIAVRRFKCIRQVVDVGSKEKKQ